MLRTFGAQQRLVYREMYRKQTLRYVMAQKQRHSALCEGPMSMAEALRQLDGFVDPSDPDTGLPNSVHAYQAARSARSRLPSDPYFHVCALIHDVGKVLFSHGAPAWAVVGDTFVVGEPLPRSAPCYDTAPAELREQRTIYPGGFGLGSAHVSWGHDEYLYQVLRQNADRHLLPPKYWDAIRYHSLYAWHSGDAYRHLMDGDDVETLHLVRELNACDLYSKDDAAPVAERDRRYFDAILRDAFPWPLLWRPRDSPAPSPLQMVSTLRADVMSSL